MQRNTKRIALVTGANRGIGLEICRQLAEKGLEVVLTARDSEKGNIAVEKLKDQNLMVHFHQLDVTDKTSIKQVADYVEEEFGRLDILVNNAGIGVGSSGADDADVEEIREIMETNFYGPLQLTQALLPLLRNSEEGRIINMSSGMGMFSEMGSSYAGYRISKTALNAFTLILSRDLNGTNIKVNAMCPGWVRTDMGGDSAPLSVEEGADTAVWLATNDIIPTGKVFRKRKEIDW